MWLLAIPDLHCRVTGLSLSQSWEPQSDAALCSGVSQPAAVVWLLSVLPFSFLLYPYRIQCFYFSHSRDLFNTVTRLLWCYKPEMFGSGFLRFPVCLLATCCLTMDQLLCNTVFICPEKKGSLLRSRLQQRSLRAPGKCCILYDAPCRTPE